MYAITPRGAGKDVGARKIKQSWPLENDETFKVDFFTTDLVLSEDLISLRIPTQAEIDAKLNIKRIIDIKQEAQVRIIRLVPNWTVPNHEQKQRNALMAGMRIVLRILKALNAAIKALNSGIQADIDAAITATDAEIEKANTAIIIAIKIKDIRDMSNLAETNGDSLAQFIIDLDAAGY